MVTGEYRGEHCDFLIQTKVEDILIAGAGNTMRAWSKQTTSHSIHPEGTFRSLQGRMGRERKKKDVECKKAETDELIDIQRETNCEEKKQRQES